MIERVVSTPPFSTQKLDALMAEAGLDLLLVTSKHNNQYMLGGHRASFFHFMDAIGTSRYLPIFLYPRGRPDQAAYIGHKLETFDREVSPFWVPTSTVSSFGIADAMGEALAHIHGCGLAPSHIGIETGFIPAEAADRLKDAFPRAQISDAQFPLERLRAVKMDWEIEKLRLASEKVLLCMQATFDQVVPGMTKADVIRLMRIEEVKHNLTFEYCWLSAGASLNRVASDQVIEEGDPFSIDSGGNYEGYVGDLARMAIVGEPDAELIDLLAEVEAVQQAAFGVIRPGTTGDEIHQVAAKQLAQSTIGGPQTHFVAHGMGLISHEAPRLTSAGPIAYNGYDADKPLEPGMVVSVETTLAHPRRGAVKLEDSLVVTPDGFDFLGEGLRGWNATGGGR